MTPEIALDLSQDGIAVLSRAEDGVWWREGIVRLDADDMAERLTELQTRAVARVGEGFTSILIIPDSQLLFTSLERDDRDPKVTIRALLRGRTPYEVEDLAFDYVQKGDRLQVAVVALETLMEAEDFAAGFGFQPVAIIGNPTDATYPGMPQFGQTGIATELLGGDRLVLDIEDGFHVIPAPFPPEMPETEEAEAEPAEAEVSESEAATEAEEKEATTEQLDVTTQEPPQEEVLPEASAPPAPPLPVTPAEAASAEATPETFDDAMAAAAVPAPTTVTPPPAAAKVSLDEAAKPEPTLPTFSSSRRSEPTLSAPSADLPQGRITPRLSSAAPDAPKAAPPIVMDKAASEPSKAFAPPKGTEPAAEPDSAPISSDAPLAASAPETNIPALPDATGKFGLPKFGFGRPKGETADPAPNPEEVALALPGIARERATAPKRGNAKLGLYLTLSLLALMALVALWSVFQDDAPAVDVAEERSIAPPPDDATQLIPNATILADDAPAEAPSEPDIASLLPGSDAVEELEAPSELVAPPAPVILAEEAPVVVEDTVEATSEAPDETFETAGNFEQLQALPEAPDTQTGEDLVIASVDPERSEADTTPLPAQPVPDAAIEQQTPATPPLEDATAGAQPAPETPVEEPAVTADPDVAAAPEAEPETTPEAPVVPATEAGTLAPGGYTVFAGRPDVEPVQRASSSVTPLVDAEPETPEISAEDDPALAILRRIRPVERPADAVAVGVTPPQPEATEEAPPIASGFTREELTRTRPRQRPESITDAAAEQAAEAARQAAEASRAAAAQERDAAVQAAAAAAVASLANQATAPVAAVSSGSGLAIARSERPSDRPRSVERAAARIVTQRREQATPAAAATAAASDEGTAPSADRSTQTIRSAGGSVARAATQSNAIRLRDINLIGVYGRPNARRALVRLANGRYVKVEVGDRLDRGRVTAIGDNQLVYQRSGRNVTLRLPNA